MRKKLLSFILILTLLLSLGAGAYAMVQGDIDGEPQQPGMEAALERARQVIKADEGKTLEELSDENNANYYHYNPYGHTTPQEPLIAAEKGDSWDDIIAKLFDKYGVEDGQKDLALAYYNTVTGETHYYNGDTYFVTASIFKVPLCMLVAEEVSSGKISIDEPIYASTFNYLEFRCLAHSDNDAAMTLETYLGGFNAFRDMEVKYMGSDPKDDIGDKTYAESYNTAEQLTNCLKILQADPEKFPGVLENMLIDTPYEYFKMWDRRYPTAQKWGYLPTTDENGAHDYVNNCGVIYTDEPIVLVVLTDNLAGGYDIIGEYATLMIDYTNYQTEVYEEKKEEADASLREELSSRSLKDLVGTISPVEKAAETDAAKEETKDTQTKGFNMSVGASLLLLLIVSAVIFSIVFIFRRNSSGRIKAIFAVIGILLAGAALILCVMAFNTGTISAEVEGNPQDTVKDFFQNLTLGQYDLSYEDLSNYSSLGLENEPESEEGKLLFDALRQSWSYTISEDPVVDRLNATQKVTLRYLDLNSLEEDAASRVDDCLKAVINEREADQIYDSNNKYLPEVTEEVYSTALDKALNSASSHYKTVDLELPLVYENGKWLIVANDELLSYLLGGVN